MEIQTDIFDAQNPLARTRESYIREAAEHEIDRVLGSSFNYFDRLPKGKSYILSVADAAFCLIDWSRLPAQRKRESKIDLLDNLLLYADSGSDRGYLMGELGELLHEVKTSEQTTIDMEFAEAARNGGYRHPL